MKMLMPSTDNATALPRRRPRPTIDHQSHHENSNTRHHDQGYPRLRFGQMPGMGLATYKFAGVEYERFRFMKYGT